MKTTIFVVIAIAALGAIGLSTAIMNSATMAHAVGCIVTPFKAYVCPPGNNLGVTPFVSNPGGFHTIPGKGP